MDVEVFRMESISHPRTRTPSPVPELELEPQNAASLPPVDGGRQAWSFLIAATVMETLIWGLPFSIGVLHAYWTTEMFKEDGEAMVTLAATLQTGLLYMSAGLMGPVFASYPQYRMRFQVIGLIVGSASMIASAFVTKPWHLVITIGAFYPFLGATYLPCATLLFEWFQSRRGLASGIMYAGTGAGGAVFPFLVSGLLSHFGYKATMIALGLGFGLLGSISLIPIKRRIPLASTRRTGRGGRKDWWRRIKTQWSFVGWKMMWVGSGVILLQGFGSFIPSLWIPTYASELNMIKPGGTGLIAIMNAASVPGNALLGHLTDRLPISMAVFLSSLVAALSCLFLWGFGTNDGPLVAFSIVYGLFALSFSALWSRMIGAIAKEEPGATPLIFSTFAFLRGIGNITSGPISDALLKVDALRGSTGGYGFRNYGILIVFTGLSIFGGGISGLLLKE